MPYTDPDKQRQAKAESYRRIYAKNKAFREAERQRKAEWLKSEKAKELNAEASARARATARVEKRRAARDPFAALIDKARREYRAREGSAKRTHKAAQELGYSGSLDEWRAILSAGIK